MICVVRFKITVWVIRFLVRNREIERLRSLVEMEELGDR